MSHEIIDHYFQNMIREILHYHKLSKSQLLTPIYIKNPRKDTKKEGYIHCFYVCKGQYSLGRILYSRRKPKTPIFEFSINLVYQNSSFRQAQKRRMGKRNLNITALIHFHTPHIAFFPSIFSIVVWTRTQNTRKRSILLFRLNDKTNLTHYFSTNASECNFIGCNTEKNELEQMLDQWQQQIQEGVCFRVVLILEIRGSAFTQLQYILFINCLMYRRIFDMILYFTHNQSSHKRWNLCRGSSPDQTKTKLAKWFRQRVIGYISSLIIEESSRTYPKPWVHDFRNHHIIILLYDQFVDIIRMLTNKIKQHTSENKQDYNLLDLNIIAINGYCQIHGYIASGSIPINLVSHDVIEVILGHESIIIKVCFHEDLFNFFVSQVFTKILCNLFQLQDSEFTLRINKNLQHCLGQSS